MTPPTPGTSLLFSFHVEDQYGKSYKVHLDPYDSKNAVAYQGKRKNGKKITISFDRSVSDLNPQDITALFLDFVNPPLSCHTEQESGEIQLRRRETGISVKKWRIYLTSPAVNGTYRLRLSLEKTLKVTAKFCGISPEETPQIVVDTSAFKNFSMEELKNRLKNLSISVQCTSQSKEPIHVHYIKLGDSASASPVFSIVSFDASKGDNIASSMQLTAKSSRLRFITNSKELAIVLHTQIVSESPLSDVARHICRLFDNVQIAIPDELDEVSELILSISLVDIQSILKVASRTIHSDKFLRFAMLRSWIRLVENVMLTGYKGYDLSSLFSVISSDSVTAAIKAINRKLKPTTERNKLSTDSLTIYLGALWSFLRVARIKGIDSIENDLKFVRNYDENRDLNRAYIAQRAKQEINDPKRRVQEFTATMNSFINYFTENKITVPEIPFKNNWWNFLEFFKFLYINKQSTIIVRLIKLEFELLKNNDSTTNLNNAFFVTGIIHVLNQIIITPNEKIEILKSAYQILKDLGNESHSVAWFCKEEYGPEVRKFAQQSARNCSVHPNEELANEARKSASSLFPIIFGYPLIPARMFHKALPMRSSTDLLDPLAAINLDADAQRKEDEYLYIPLYACESRGTAADPLDGLLEKFCADSSKKVARVEGKAGSGKSCAAKQVAWQNCHELAVSVNPKTPRTYYIDIPRLKDKGGNEFVSAGLRAALSGKTPGTPRGEENKINSAIAEKLEHLKKESFTLFIDGLDEISKQDLENFFAKNLLDMKKYPLAKFVFFYREGYFGTKFFDDLLTLGKFSTFYLADFAPEQVDNYVWNYFQQRPYSEEDEELDLWTYEKCREVLEILISVGKGSVDKKGIREVFSNPFLLSTCVKILPYVVAKFTNEELAKQPPNAKPRPLKIVLEGLGQTFENEILKAHVCVTAVREQNRSQSKPLELRVSAQDILEFQVRLASCFKDQSISEGIGLPLSQAQKSTLNLAGKSDEQILCLFQASLIQRNDIWEFRHIKLKQFFTEVPNIDGFLTQLKEYISKNVYEINKHSEKTYPKTDNKQNESND